MRRRTRVIWAAAAGAHASSSITCMAPAASASVTISPIAEAAPGEEGAVTVSVWPVGFACAMRVTAP